MGARAGQSPSRILTAMSRTRSKIFVSVSPTSHLYWEADSWPRRFTTVCVIHEISSFRIAEYSGIRCRYFRSRTPRVQLLSHPRGSLFKRGSFMGAFPHRPIGCERAKDRVLPSDSCRQAWSSYLTSQGDLA